MERDKLSTIILEKTGGVATISLNRPEVHNALNLEMIREITAAIELLNSDEAVSLIVFRSAGAHFCSGADLNWMQSGLTMPKAQLEKESLELAKLFRVIWESAALSICAVKGVISGGANGLLAASDLVLAESSAIFTFPEVKLGLIPATIAPYILRKAGFSRTTDWMMTGRQIDVVEAREAGLIHRICRDGQLEEKTELLTGELMSGGVQALKGVKQLLRQLEIPGDPHETDKFTSRLIAGFRISPEGQEGMKAMLEKRKARWDEER